jgi:excisionase family DNA binding protein
MAEAAALLNVSEPYLIGLLDAGKIACLGVGDSRRINADSLAAYKRDDDRERGAAADELTALSQELGP